LRLLYGLAHEYLHPRRNTKTGDNQENDQACSSAPVVLVATQTRLIQKITLAGLWWSCRRPCTLGLPPTTRTPAGRALGPNNISLAHRILQVCIDICACAGRAGCATCESVQDRRNEGYESARSKKRGIIDLRPARVHLLNGTVTFATTA